MNTTDSHHPFAEAKAPGLLLQLLELRAPWEFASSMLMSPFLANVAPAGDGHPVLVLPGLISEDGSTSVLRGFLKRRGYAVSGWGQGFNLGFRPGVREQALETLRTLHETHGRKVSLVGWSLGGIFARELAKDMPDAVRQVITLGTPFTGHPRQTNAWRLYERVSGHHIGSHDLHGPLKVAPPVPTTSIWSRTDGVVAWRCSVESRQHEAENIEVEASHCGLGAHPAVLYAVADRLAQPEGQWQPFQRKGWRSVFYGNADAAHNHQAVAA